MVNEKMVIKMGCSGYGNPGTTLWIEESQINEFKQELLDAENKNATYIEKVSEKSYVLPTDLTDLSGINKKSRKKTSTAKKNDVTAYDLISIMKKRLPEMNENNVELYYQLSLYSSALCSLDEFKNIGKEIITTHNIDGGNAHTPSYHPGYQPSLTRYNYYAKRSSRFDFENNLEIYLEKLSGLQPPIEIAGIFYRYDLRIGDRINKVRVDIEFRDSSDGKYSIVGVTPDYAGFGKITDPVLEDLKRDYNKPSRDYWKII